MQNIRKNYFIAIAILLIALIVFLTKYISDINLSNFDDNPKPYTCNDKVGDIKNRTEISSATVINSTPSASKEKIYANDLEALTLSRTRGEGTSMRLIDSLGGVSFDMIKKYSLSSDDIAIITSATNEFIKNSAEQYSKHLSNSIIATDDNENTKTYYVQSDADLLSAPFSEFKVTMINHFGSQLGEELSRSFPAESYFGGMGNRNVKIFVRQLNGDTFNALVTEYDPKNNRPIKSSQLFYEQFNRMFPNLLNDKGAPKAMSNY